MLPSLIGEERLDLMRTLASSSPFGCFVEVGVYKGGSAKVLYDLSLEQRRKLYLYDTFNGIPFQHPKYDNHKIGDFSDVNMDDLIKEMPLAVFLSGVFPETLVDMPPIAFVHADGDQYQTTKDVCEILGPMMSKGGMMLFDDYIGLEGCIRAVDECLPQREILLDGRALVRF